MNQILITKKLYVTPELKRKKKIYKIDFIVSVFLVIALISFYIYAEYDRSKEEGVAKDILTSLSSTERNIAENDIMDISLNENENANEETANQNENNEENKQGIVVTKDEEKGKIVRSKDGTAYISLATVTIPSINLKYPVLKPEAQTTAAIEKMLKISPCKFWGPEANEVGNFCIVGHNYRNTKFFSKVPSLKAGDAIEITDVSGKTLRYKVYDKYTVDPSDVSCTSQLTGGRREVTLITCTDNGEQRVIIKARESR